MKKLITGRIHYFDPANQIVFQITLGGAPNQADLIAAIQKAVRQHAISRLGIVLDDKGDSFFQDIPQRDVSVSVYNAACDLPNLISEQHKIPFDVASGEFFRFFLYLLPQSTQIVIVSHHLAGDGLSMLYLIRDILSTLARPDENLPEKSLQTMEDFGYPDDSSLVPFAKLILNRINKSWNKRKKVFTHDEYLRMYDSYWRDHALELEYAELSGADLRAFQLRCKANGVSINSAITAALLQALGTDKVGMAVSVRPSDHEGLGNYASGLSVRCPWNEKIAFWTHTKTIHQTIHQKLHDNRRKYYVLRSLERLEPTLIDAMYFSMYTDYSNKTAEKMAVLSKYRGNQQHTTSITNLAKLRIPSVYGKYRIDEILFVPPLIATSKSMLGVVTVEDKMSLTFQYVKNDRSGFFEHALAETIQIIKNNCTE